MSTYKDKYKEAKTWRRKVIIMSLFHSVLRARKKNHSVRFLAKYFEVSVGLVSENLRITAASNYKRLIRCTTRKRALELLKG